MKIIRHSPAFYAAVDKIPEPVAQIVQWEEPTNKQLVKETITEYGPSGSVWSINHFCIDEDDLLDHVKQAARRTDCSVDITESLVTITRTLRDKSRKVATYVPMTA